MKGIDFTPDMHRAIRENRKHMTRRKLNPQPAESFGWYPNETAKTRKHYAQENHFRKGAAIDHAKYKVGDRVFVRETWATVEFIYNFEVTYALDEVVDLAGERPRSMHPGLYGAGIGPRNSKILYRDDYDHYDDVEERGFKWRSPRFMPEWASRTILEITGVRVERVNEITNEDAIAEGVPHGSDHPMCIDDCRTAFSRFRELWESIHGPGAWARNDWVFVYEFKVTNNA